MSLYTLMVFLHITAAVLLLSTSIVGEPLVRAASRRTAAVRDLGAFLEVGRPMARLSPLAALAVLATGIYLATAGRVWTLGWVQVSTALWVVNSVVAPVVVRPAIGRVEAAVSAATDGTVGADLEELRWSRGWSWGQDVLATNDAVMLALMTLRPGIGGSILLALLANGLVAGGRQALGLQGTRARPVGVAPGA